MAKTWLQIVDEMDDMKEKPRESYIQAPFAWPGGKSQLVDKILPLMPTGRDKIFVDVCGGSGIMTINSSQSYKQKVYNDRHSGVTAFYRCLQNPALYNALVERLKVVIHSREEFIWCRDTWENVTDQVERAARWYYMLKFSFASLGRNFARSTSGVNSLAVKYQNAFEYFSLIHNAFKNVLVENADIFDLLKDFDSPDTVFYIDPDYIGAYKIYKHGVDHNRLIQWIGEEAKGFVALSGYPSQLYDSQPYWDYRYEWPVAVTVQSQAFTETNNLAGKENVMDRSKSRAIEVLWIKEPK